MPDEFPITVAAGSLRGDVTAAVVLPHKWTDGGVAVDADFTGGHLLHLAAAGCVLNDIYREASNLGIAIDGVKVEASGGFDSETSQSTGITYSVELDSPEQPDRLMGLLRLVDDIAEIPRAIRAGAEVSRG
ncbi:MAG: OsmC family protein [Frankiaceae bacterium]|nr:OsmC family protein [Frankiaceae bacterium]